MGKETLRICEKGHRYFKSSDCPTCPICEAEKKPKDGFLENLSAPARRALIGKGITALDHLSLYTEEEIRELHGIGQNALNRIHQLLQQNNLNFKQ